MPMPPTRRLTAATAPSSAGQDACRALQRLRDLRRIEDVEVVLLGATDVAPFAQQRLDRRGDGGRVVGWIDLHHDHSNVALAREATLHRLDRHQDHVVLVVAEAALSARDERADHLAGQVAQADPLPERILVAKQVALHGRADHAHGLARLLLGRRERAAGRRGPLLGREIIRGRAVDRGGPVRRVAHGEPGRLRHGDRRDDARDLVADGSDVVHLEVGRRRTAAAATKSLSRTNLEQVRAEPGDLLAHCRRRALAERHHGDDRGDADDDAEHGQERPQQVAADLAQGKHDGGAEHR